MLLFLQLKKNLYLHGHVFVMIFCQTYILDAKVNIGNCQKMAQSERNSHSKNRGGKKLN